MKNIQVKINGSAQAISFKKLPELLNANGWNKEKVVIELNGTIIPPDQYPEILLKNGDELEILQFVGGG